MDAMCKEIKVEDADDNESCSDIDPSLCVTLSNSVANPPQGWKRYRSESEDEEVTGPAPHASDTKQIVVTLKATKYYKPNTATILDNWAASQVSFSSFIVCSYS
jgi:hypothetical protein